MEVVHSTGVCSLCFPLAVQDGRSQLFLPHDSHLDGDALLATYPSNRKGTTTLLQDPAAGIGNQSIPDH